MNRPDTTTHAPFPKLILAQFKCIDLTRAHGRSSSQPVPWVGVHLQSVRPYWEIGKHPDLACNDMHALVPLRCNLTLAAGHHLSDVLGSSVMQCSAPHHLCNYDHLCFAEWGGGGNCPPPPMFRSKIYLTQFSKHEF